MGRHRKHPTTHHSVKKPNNYKDSEETRVDVERANGVRNSICVDCDANNPPDADSCRKCGSDVRPRSDRFD